ncbi:hypothetical protein E1B28_000251 [Marasmius oreades]|uniref:cAMP-independent regulatory protein pac2 n=1 Tax=Marasmius oreades TaxID=181124 RepID=A0A9P7V0Y3_9AGAR|nr:uncharacterized protein E1B28_000251 [Marasmius oreades]KAG7098288.1 hypothetical protein E1B28_000251 [Marasmius oreades]
MGSILATRCRNLPDPSVTCLDNEIDKGKDQRTYFHKVSFISDLPVGGILLIPLLSPLAGNPMQRATCTGLRIRSPSDARVIFHAVLMNILPMVTRRLDTEERALITPGSVYVWEERGPHAELTGVGIERWTDGIRWGPSRVREGFLFYHEKQDHHNLYSDSVYDPHNVSARRRDSSWAILIKQTYTVFVETPQGQRKWHLIAYFTEESLEHLQCVDDLPHLASLPVPHGRYKSARSSKGRPEYIFSGDQQPSGSISPIEYISYAPDRSSSPSSSSRESPNSPKWHDREQAHGGYPLGLFPPPSPQSPAHGHDRRVHRGAENLAPLVYLQAISPPRRYPEDEKTLKLLASGPRTQTTIL